MAEGMLTYDNPNGTWGLNNGYDIMEAPAELREALCRLHDYEKTGFSVESVMEIRDMYDEAVHKGEAMVRATGKINSINIITSLSKPENITRLIKLVREAEKILLGTGEKSGVNRKDGGNDKL